MVDIQPSTGLVQAIEQRRATRSFRSDAIPDAILQEIFRLGVRAPSGYNLQPWRFIVVQDAKNKAKLQECAFNQPKVTEAPVMLICCGDRNAGSSDKIEAVIELGKKHNAVNEDYAQAMYSKIPSFFENAPSFNHPEAWTNRHTMLAVAQMMIVAKSFGVDSCPMEGFSSEQVREAFQIPESVDICCLLALGFTDEPNKQYGGRFDIEEVFFAEKYGESFSL